MKDRITWSTGIYKKQVDIRRLIDDETTGKINLIYYGSLGTTKSENNPNLCRVKCYICFASTNYGCIITKLNPITLINWIASIGDMQVQLDRLVYKGFLQQTPVEKLTELPRYLQAMLMRLDKLKHAATRDQQRLPK